jgi:hydroxymethylbilane synthase
MGRFVRLKISSRKSDLARLQAYQVGESLQKQNPDLEIQYNFRESLGDKNLTDPLWKMPEKGVFTEDFVQDLLDGSTDLVVHSWKDLPTAPRNGTAIVATMPRADQRDLLLFKRSDIGKVLATKKIKIFSSSPRRAYNLAPFLKNHMPFNLSDVEFCNVRGNIQTRVRKLMEDPEVSALIVAKAAIDRLLSTAVDEFLPTQIFLESCLQSLDWMVLPLSVNPNAAAQGALAIEIKQGRDDLTQLLKSIDCPQTFASAEKEREVLASFGGGCHQKIGVAVLKRAYGEVFFLKGFTDQAVILDEEKIIRPSDPKKFPASLLGSSKELPVIREKTLSIEIPPEITALWVAKAEAFPANLNFVGCLWTAGLQTWQKLADQGHWVHGTAEGLGEDEDPQIEILAGAPLKWAKLTHGAAPVRTDKQNFATYQVSVTTANWRMGSRESFFWHSGSQFLAALSKEPGLKNKLHACGPGNTYKILREKLGADAAIEIYLNEKEWRSSCSL